MKSGTILKSSFLISLITLAGLFLKILHSDIAEILLIIGLISTFIFIVAASFEVWTSTRIKNSEKIMWTIALIFMNPLTGFVYLFSGRKRVSQTI